MRDGLLFTAPPGGAGGPTAASPLADNRQGGEENLEFLLGTWGAPVSRESLLVDVAKRGAGEDARNDVTALEAERGMWTGFFDEVSGTSRVLAATSNKVLRVLKQGSENVKQLELELCALRAENQVLRASFKKDGTGKSAPGATAAKLEGLPSSVLASTANADGPPPVPPSGAARSPQHVAPRTEIPGMIPSDSNEVSTDMRMTDVVDSSMCFETDSMPRNSVPDMGSEIDRNSMVRLPSTKLVRFNAPKYPSEEEELPRLEILANGTGISPLRSAPHSYYSHLSQSSLADSSTQVMAFADTAWTSPQPQQEESSRAILHLHSSTSRGSGIALSDGGALRVLEVWAMSSKISVAGQQRTYRKPGKLSATFSGPSFSAPTSPRSEASAPEENHEGEDLLEEGLVVYQSDSSFLRKMILSPYSSRRSAWDLISLVLVIYDMVTIPLQFFDPPDSTFTTFMTWTTRIFWTCDMPLSFISGFVMHDGAIEMRFSPICKRYLRMWFPLDCIVVGVDWLELILQAGDAMGFARIGKASRTFRILRMIRLLRLFRMGMIFGLITERIYSEKWLIVADIAKIFIIIIGLAHFIACIWYGIAAAEDPPNNWIYAYNFENHDLNGKYGISLHWSLSQFAGGMDEVTPENESERAFAIVVFVCCFIMASVMVSRLTSSMTQLHLLSQTDSKQLTVLRRYLHQNQISKNLVMRVTRNAQHCIKEQQRAMPESEVDLLGSISEPLRVELHFEMYTPVFNIHPFFREYSKEVAQVMRKVCHLATSISLVSRGDVVFSAGEKALTMYFVVKGHLQYSSKTRGICEVTENDKCWISEPSLWAGNPTFWTHKGVLRVHQETRLLCLNSQKFQEIVLHFDHHQTDFDPRVYAQEFVEMFNKSAEADDLTFWCEEDLDEMATEGQSEVTKALSHNLRRLSSRSSDSFGVRGTHGTNGHGRRHGMLQRCLGCLGLHSHKSKHSISRRRAVYEQRTY